jgi:hypothetical protein
VLVFCLDKKDIKYTRTFATETPTGAKVKNARPAQKCSEETK